jgi:hypothetical protein
MQQPFIFDEKGSHDLEPILPGIANPKFVYEEHI